MTASGKICFVFAATMATMWMSKPASAFMIRSPAPVSSTRLYLEDWVANLIDDELYRQSHRKEYEAEWMQKNRAAVLHRMESDFGPLNPDADESDFRTYYKDKKMALSDPERYCADRCVATGNCDIFQDFYEMSPKDVIKFCTECVLSADEDGECDLPKGFYDGPHP